MNIRLVIVMVIFGGIIWFFTKHTKNMDGDYLKIDTVQQSQEVLDNEREREKFMSATVNEILKELHSEGKITTKELNLFSETAKRAVSSERPESEPNVRLVFSEENDQGLQKDKRVIKPASGVASEVASILTEEDLELFESIEKTN